jgi:hypothetical protein
MFVFRTVVRCLSVGGICSRYRLPPIAGSGPFEIQDGERNAQPRSEPARDPTEARRGKVRTPEILGASPDATRYGKAPEVLTMPTVAEMNRAFSAYLREMEDCAAAECYWALLHIVMAMPDICSALETEKGVATGQRYREWCIRYLKERDPYLTPREWWDVRCALLHQGRTKTRSKRYENYAYSRPGPRGETDHGKVVNRVLNLDVGQLAAEMRAAMGQWFADVDRRPNWSRARNVGRHLDSVARSEAAKGPIPRPLTPVIQQDYTTSSP